MWKFERQDSREQWEKERIKSIDRRKKEGKQQVVWDDQVWQIVASVGLLYHLSLLPKSEQK
jgi:hypothetical protein